MKFFLLLVLFLTIKTLNDGFEWHNLRDGQLPQNPVEASSGHYICRVSHR